MRVGAGAGVGVAMTSKGCPGVFAAPRSVAFRVVTCTWALVSMPSTFTVTFTS